jgi:predicted acylesterase/phospholipase RssA
MSGLFNSVKIWEAARATSAASTFFEPIKIGPNGQQFFDGGTIANNPIRQLWLEAQDIWGPQPGMSDKLPLAAQVKCIVSIGTGMPTVESFGTDLLQVGRTLKAQATETEITANLFVMEHLELESPRRYFRFNVTHGLEDVGLEEASKRDIIAGRTQRYGGLGTTKMELRLFRTCAQVGAQETQGR